MTTFFISALVCSRTYWSLFKHLKGDNHKDVAHAVSKDKIGLWIRQVGPITDVSYRSKDIASDSYLAMSENFVSSNNKELSLNEKKTNVPFGCTMSELHKPLSDTDLDRSKFRLRAKVTRQTHNLILPLYCSHNISPLEMLFINNSVDCFGFLILPQIIDRLQQP